MSENISKEVLINGLTRGLDNIISRIEALEAKTSGTTTSTVETTVTEAPPFTPDAPAPVSEIQETENTSVELDKQNCPWDERINSTTRTKTAKGIWKKLRGVDEDLYEEVIAEIKVSKRDTSKDVCINVERTDGHPANPVVPVVPAAPAVPPTPTAPVAPAAPAAPSVPEVTPRAELNEVLSKLTDHYGIDPAKVIETAMKPFGGDTVSSLTDFDGALKLAKHWLLLMDTTEKVDDHADSLMAEYDGVIIAGADHAQAIEAALPTFYGSATPGAKRPQELNYEDIEKYCSTVTKYLNDYEAYLKANK